MNPDSTTRRKLGTTVERHWFFSRGLLGLDFRWDSWQKNLDPKRDDDRQRLQKDIEQMTAADAQFPKRARDIALEALTSADRDVVSRGIQVLCFVGREEDMARISELCDGDDEIVAKHARSCLFERKMRVR